MSEFTIGADPEIFLTKGGKAVSAHGVIPGTKKKPYAIPEGAIQVDGMAVEFNVEPVPLQGGYEKAFVSRMAAVMKGLKAAVKKKDNELEFNISSTQDFDDEVISSQPKKALELGCEPDYDAYTLLPNPRPNGEVSFRTASGHIHCGWGAGITETHPDHIEICANFVKILDATVGMFMTIIDDDPRRRELYGKAGAFRPKNYGVEYRTPSNVWLKTHTRMRTIFILTSAAVGLMKRQYKLTLDYQKIINEGDYKAAYDALKDSYYDSLIGHNAWESVVNEYTDRLKREGKSLPKEEEKNKKGTVKISSQTYQTIRVR